MKKASRKSDPVVPEPDCNWVESNILQFDCDISRETIVSITEAIDVFLDNSFRTVEDGLTSMIEKSLSTPTDDPQINPVESDLSLPQIKPKSKAAKYLDDMRLKIVEQITAFLDERLSLDRLSLLSFKKQMLESVTICRETSYEYRRAYDLAARHREEENIKHVLEQSQEKLEAETEHLTKSLGEMEQSNSVLSRQLDFLLKEREKLNILLNKAHDELRMNPRNTKSRKGRKKDKKGKKGGSTSPVHHKTEITQFPATSTQALSLNYQSDSGYESGPPTQSATATAQQGSANQHQIQAQGQGQGQGMCHRCAELQLEVVELEKTINHLKAREAEREAHSHAHRSKHHGHHHHHGHKKGHHSHSSSPTMDLPGVDGVHVDSDHSRTSSPYLHSENEMEAHGPVPGPDTGKDVIAVVDVATSTASAGIAAEGIHEDTARQEGSDGAHRSEGRVHSGRKSATKRGHSPKHHHKTTRPHSGSNGVTSTTSSGENRADELNVSPADAAIDNSKELERVDSSPAAPVPDSSSSIDGEQQVAGLPTVISAPTAVAAAAALPAGAEVSGVAPAQTKSTDLVEETQAKKDKVDSPAVKEKRVKGDKKESSKITRSDSNTKKDFAGRLDSGKRGVAGVKDTKGGVDSTSGTDPSAKLHQDVGQVAQISAATLEVKPSAELVATQNSPGVAPVSVVPVSAVHDASANSVAPAHVAEYSSAGNMASASVANPPIGDSSAVVSSNQNVISSEVRLPLESTAEALARATTAVVVTTPVVVQRIEEVAKVAIVIDSGLPTASSSANNTQRDNKTYRSDDDSESLGSIPDRLSSNHLKQSSVGSFSIVDRENIYRDHLLNEAREVQQELQTRLLSLEYQNNKLSKKLRSEEANYERQEALHKLQIQERDLLLRVLSEQVKELRTTLARQEALAKLSAPPLIPVREIGFNRADAASKKQNVPLPNIKWDTSSDFVSSALQPKSDRDEVSASMPDLFQRKQSPPHTTSSLFGRGANDSAATRPMTTSHSQRSSRGSNVEAAAVLTEKVRSAAAANRPMPSLIVEETSDLLSSQSNPQETEARLKELRGVRRQIASLLVEQNNRPKKKETVLATSMSAQAKLVGRELSLKPLANS